MKCISITEIKIQVFRFGKGNENANFIDRSILLGLDEKTKVTVKNNFNIKITMFL